MTVETSAVQNHACAAANIERSPGIHHEAKIKVIALAPWIEDVIERRDFLI